jgi:hypothetical protein
VTGRKVWAKSWWGSKNEVSARICPGASEELSKAWTNVCPTSSKAVADVVVRL